MVGARAQIVLDRIKSYDYSKLVPSYRSEKHSFVTFGVELTWKYEGPGIGIGFLKTDYWIGWPFQR